MTNSSDRLVVVAGLKTSSQGRPSPPQRLQCLLTKTIDVRHPLFYKSVVVIIHLFTVTLYVRCIKLYTRTINAGFKCLAHVRY